ncbi:hypothetical protein FMM75_23430 [Lachnospiraceae bacterium MD335]|nr:hypothetical protein [Lachnospiraceae bacterium MD335]
MNLKEKCRMLGLGCYGGKQAREFITLGYKGNAANGSEQDLKALGDIPKFRLEGFDGFGGHRERAEDCLVQNGEFVDFIENIKEEIIFVFFGGGGSTGSGCATIVSEMLLTQDEGTNKIVCPVIALPSQDEPIAKHRNAYQAVVELQELEGLGATFFINNDSGKDYTSLNSTFTKFLDTFLTNDSYGELNNFDESERLEMLKDSGMMVISLMGAKENQSLDQALLLQKLTKDGIFAPIESNKICENIAIIHAGRNNSDIEKDSIIAEVGKPKNVFEGYNGRSTLVAVSGLDYPVSHVAKLGEIAKTAYEERQRDRKHVSKLGNLDFMEEKESKAIPEKKVSSKLAGMRKKMQEMSK